MFPYVCIGIFNGEGNIEKYIVFAGNDEIEVQSLFSEIEWTYVQEKKHSIHRSQQWIHPDDTIHTIKQKLLVEFSQLEGLDSSTEAKVDTQMEDKPTEEEVEEEVVKENDENILPEGEVEAEEADAEEKIKGGSESGLENDSKKISYDEMYLFYEKYQSMTSYAMNELLLASLNHTKVKGALKRDAMTETEKNQFLINHGFEWLETSEENADTEQGANPDKWDYEQWKTIWPYNNHFSSMMPLGRRFPKLGLEDPLFCSNPFRLLNHTIQEWIEKNRKPIIPQTSDAELLLNFIPSSVGVFSKDQVKPKTEKNRLMLYLATADACMKYHKSQFSQISSENTEESVLFALYYPYLYEKKIRTFAGYEEYKANRPSEVGKIHFSTQERVNMFYNIYKTRVNPMPYIRQGVSSFHFMILNPTPIQLPLETIFKNFHANDEIPYVQYNPGLKQELLYRLYTNKMAINGKKIPFLDRLILRKWGRQIRNKKKSQLCFGFQPKMKQWSGELFVRLYQNGDVEIQGNPEKLWEVKELEKKLLKMVNPLIDRINVTIQNSGYKISSFYGWLPYLEDDGDDIIESKGKSVLKILNMSYQWKAPVSDSFSLEKTRSCLSVAFDYTPEWNEKENPVLIFKRVDHYHSMSSDMQMVAHYYEQDLSVFEILRLLQSEHQKTQEEAVRIHSEYLNELQSERQREAYRIPGRKMLRSGGAVLETSFKENPGFPVKFSVNTVSNELTIDVEHVLDFAYLETMSVYVDVLLRLSIHKFSNEIPASIDWKRLCSLSSSRVVTEEVENIPQAQIVLLEEIGNEEEEEESGYEGLLEEEEVGKNKYLLQEKEEEDEEMSLPDYLDEDLESLVDAEEEKWESSSDIVEEEIVEDTGDGEPETGEEIVEDTGEGDEIGEKDEDEDDLSDLDFDEIDEEVQSEVENDSDEEGAKKGKEKKNQAGKSNQKDLKTQVSQFLAKSKKRKGEKAGEKAGEKGGDKTESAKNIQKYWVDRMKKRDPVLFEIYDQKGKEIPNFKTYSSSCQVKVQRQPVILTDEEKRKIDQEHPGSYSQALKYSSEKGKEMWYICPRFWCMKTNSPLTAEEVKQGKCGKNVVPVSANDSSKNPNLNTSLIEFNHPNQHYNEKQEYVPNTPGFIKHDGVCMPCCFKIPKSSDQTCEETENVGFKSSYDYVLSDTKMLAPSKWGFLPSAIQSFLQYSPNLKEIMDGKKMKLLKPILLRYGVEQIPGQSFMGVVADLYAAIRSKEENKEIETPSVQEMREILIQNIILDDFVQYNNGSLVASFRASNLKNLESYFDKLDAHPNPSLEEKSVEPDEMNLSESKYKSSQFMERIKPDNEAKRKLVADTVASYENFLAFLGDEESVLDPTYLWDVLSKPNPRLFPKGINLILLSIPDNDLTQNVEVVCPNAVYSSELFDPKKLSAMVILRNGIYEPIYILQRTEKDTNQSTKLFASERSSLLNGTIRIAIDFIRRIVQSQCSPQASIPTYRFTTPIYLKELIQTIQDLKYYSIEGYVWNYHGKIVGILVSPYPNATQTAAVMLPCYPTTEYGLPSTHQARKNNRFMDEKGVATNLDTTLKMLRKIHQHSLDHGKTKIPCLPQIEIVEDEMIVGILTQTNQMVAIDPPVAAVVQEEAEVGMRYNMKKGRKLERDTNTLLSVLRSVNYNEVDKTIATAETSEKERERDEVVKNIRLENQFYNVFRSTLRVLLNSYEQRNLHKTIVENIRAYKKDQTLYQKQLEIIRGKLSEMMADYVEFVEYDPKVLESLYDWTLHNEMTTCSSQNTTSHYCLAKNNSSTASGVSSAPAATTVMENIGKSLGILKGGGALKDQLGKLLVPKTHLLSKVDNQRSYFIRAADELLRYPRIQNYLLYPKSFLNVQWSEYKLFKNEMILFQSVLFHDSNHPEMDYFKDLVALPLHNYVQTLHNEFATPLKKESFRNRIEKDDTLQVEGRRPTPKNVQKIEEEQQQEEASLFEKESEAEEDTKEIDNAFKVFYDQCIEKTDKIVGNTDNSTWKRSFPNQYKEIFFENQTHSQSFCCMIHILYHYSNSMYTVAQMCQLLIESYRPWMNAEKNRDLIRRKTMNFLKPYNASITAKTINAVIKGKQDWEVFFWNEEYHFTELDFWVLSDALSIPIVLFSTYPLKYLFPNKNIKWILLSKNALSKTKKCYFVRPPTQRMKISKYQMITPSVDLRNVKDYKAEPSLSLWEQVEQGFSGGDFSNNVISLENYWTME